MPHWELDESESTPSVGSSVFQHLSSWSGQAGAVRHPTLPPLHHCHLHLLPSDHHLLSDTTQPPPALCCASEPTPWATLSATCAFLIPQSSFIPSSPPQSTASPVCVLNRSLNSHILASQPSPHLEMPRDFIVILPLSPICWLTKSLKLFMLFFYTNLGSCILKCYYYYLCPFRPLLTPFSQAIKSWNIVGVR